MPNADELLASGDIQGARAELIKQVRSEPGNTSVRMFLFQLFSLTGEWKRAKAQLDTLAQLDPVMQMLSVAYSQCIEAENERATVFAGEADMPFLAKVDWGAELATHLKAFVKSEDGAGAKLLAFQNGLPGCKGTADDEIKFDWISDADPRFGATIEAIISGRYGLIPFTELESLKIYKPQDLRDTIWAQAEFGLSRGAKVAGFIPVRYPGSEQSSDDSIVLGQSSSWTEIDGLEIGSGHRLLMMSGGNERPLLSFEKITIEAS